MSRKAIAAAFPGAVLVLTGFLAIGIAFGLMLQSIGYGAGWAFSMSLVIFAGSGQYLGVSLLALGAPLTAVALLTFIVTFRHLVYGLSLLEKLRGMGWRKLYMMFGLTDETYALLSSANPPEGVKTHYFYFWIALLNHSYWLVGSVIGAVAGQLLGFDTTGVDFAMPALFIVIAVDQWKSYPRHLPALLGAVATVVCLALFGQENMLVPALAIIVLVLTLARPHLDHTKTKGADAV